MPFYYDVTRSVTTNGSANTESQHFRVLTVSNQKMFRLMGLYGACQSGTAGGARVRLKTAGVAGSLGTAQIPAKRNADSPAADTTWFNDASALTAGTTLTTRLTVGMAQTGGMGGWVALEMDHALSLKPNGGPNGNAEIYTIANGASIAADLTAEFQEN